MTRLKQIEELTGVYHDAPVRAVFPYAVVVCNDDKGWNCKRRKGREISVQLVLWDDQPARLLALAEEVALSPRSVLIETDWHLSSLMVTGKRQVRNPGGPWNCMFDLRARLLSTVTGEEP